MIWCLESVSKQVRLVNGIQEKQDIAHELIIVELGDGNTEAITSLYYSANFAHLIFSVIKSFKNCNYFLKIE